MEGEADKVHGETIPIAAGHQVSLVREPLGVTAPIIPWTENAGRLQRVARAVKAAARSS